MDYLLVKPDKDRHRYVVGIDFGHGETSAAWCELEWDKSAGKRESVAHDIELIGNLRVIPSAINITSDGRCHVGKDAFHSDCIMDGAKMRVGFKQCPKEIEGESEQLMIEYMRSIYARIIEKVDKLQKGNHIVYIARPSGWTDDRTKCLYQRMALEADIPLGGLTSESRAAIFYAINRDEFKKNVLQGGIVFDLGSSTLDFTYLNFDDPDPIDHGYPCGASIIEQAIFEQLLLKDNVFSDFLKKYPMYKDAFLFECRKKKEAIYNTSDTNLRVRERIELAHIVNLDSLPEEDINKYEDVALKLRFSNVNEFNEWLEQVCHYKTDIENAIRNYLNQWIRDKKVYGVYLAGGATRMNFLKPIIAEMFQLSDEQVKGDSEPSLTVSRGIALIGTADAITSVLREDLERKKTQLIEPQRLRSRMDKLVQDMAGCISETSWNVVHEACSDFKRKDLDKNLGVKDLETDIRMRLEKFTESGLLSVISGVFNQFFQCESEDVRMELNDIIRYYAPGQEIKNVRNEVSDISLDIQSISDICMKRISGIVSKLLWAALGLFLFGVFSLIYQAIKFLIYKFKSEESRRKDICQELEKNESKIKSDIKSELVKTFLEDASFSNIVSKELKSYLEKLIQYNIDRVRIPIE